MLLAAFCTRLACGLVWLLAVCSPRAVGAAYFRTLTLLVLGLLVLAAMAAEFALVKWLLVGSSVLAFVSCAVWTLSPADSGSLIARSLTGSLAVVTGGVLLLLAWTSAQGNWARWLWASGVALSSAWLLGAMLGAMLLGHSYLIRPNMTIDPLQRLLLLAGGALVLRVIVALMGLGLFGSGSLELWPQTVRCLVGFVAPAIVVWMVWQTAKIRSTQSATGILYVGVVFTFFGELTSLVFIP